MTTPLGSVRFYLGLIIAALTCCFAGRVDALTVTATTSDNGKPAHLVSWTDASGNPRSAMMVDENSINPGPYTGYLRQYTYVVSGQNRVCTGTSSYPSGSLETSGEGFIQLHGPGSGSGISAQTDLSSGNGVGCPGTTTISPSSGTLSHVTITYSMQQLISADDGNAYTLPTTVQWFFADGRNDPIFSVTHDSSSYVSSHTADLSFNTLSPYGDMSYAGPGDPLVGGFSFGDQYKFVTLASAPEEVSLNSGWNYKTANIIPYTLQWTEPSSANAEMGNVATVPLFVSDAGQDSQTYNGGPYGYVDYRNQSAVAGTYALAGSADEAYDIFPYQMLTEALSTTATDAKRMTWGSNFGRVGGFDQYNGYSGTITTYPKHSLDLANNSVYTLSSYLSSGSGQYSPSTVSFSADNFTGGSGSGAMTSYSVYMVFGTHYGSGGNVVGSSYLTGAVGSLVTQMENAAQATLSASTGTVATSGPSGVGPAASTSVTYVPAGYNPVFSTWELNASSNAVSATLTPTNSKSIVNPVFLVDNYTSSQLPASISINGHSTSGTDYYATVDTANQRLWITANSTASSAMTLAVTAPSSTDVFGGVSEGGTTRYSSWFGYYDAADYPLVYEYYLGYEYSYDAGGGGVYLYDYASGHFFYTQPSYFPYLYDFTLNTFLYYYNSNTPHRHFYDFGIDAVIVQ